MEKKIVWLPEDVAKKVEAATSENAQMAVIQDYLDATKKSMAGDLDAMEEDSVRFKGMLLAYKKMYREALEAHNDAVYKVWEDIDGNLPNMKEKAGKLIAELDVVFPELDKAVEKITAICDKLEHINTYQLKSMIELVRQIECADEKTRDILVKVLAK